MNLAVYLRCRWTRMTHIVGTKIWLHRHNLGTRLLYGDKSPPHVINHSFPGWTLHLRLGESQVLITLPTCGGGRPPAPSGHTGSMVSFLGVLHWQSGDGLTEFHSGLASLSIRTGLTRGISHSVVMLLHGKSLPVGEIERFNQTNQQTVQINWSRFVKVAHSSGSSTMQRVPKPGLSNNTSPKYLIWESIGRSLLQRTNKYTLLYLIQKMNL